MSGERKRRSALRDWLSAPGRLLCRAWVLILSPMMIVRNASEPRTKLTSFTVAAASARWRPEASKEIDTSGATCRVKTKRGAGADAAGAGAVAAAAAPVAAREEQRTEAPVAS